MTQFFSQNGRLKQHQSGVHRKKCDFQVEIRKNCKEEIKKHLRNIHFGIGQHIIPMVNALPSSFPEILKYIFENPEHQKVISKLIVDRIYKTEIKPKQQSKQSQKKFEWRSFIIPQEPPNSQRQLKKRLYFFIILLENEGTYAPHIFQKYFPILKSQSQKFQQPVLLFDLINIVVMQNKLNWVPIDQLVSIIEVIQLKDQNKVSQQQAQVYLNLSKNYYEVARDNLIVRNRILKLLQQGSECFQRIKPKTFFKICLSLTFHQNTQKYIDQYDGEEKKTQLYFHKSMLKGSLIKNLYRQIFYSSNQSLRKICLNILGNLIIQLQSTFMWMEQKFDPIGVFQTQIKNTSNSMQTFYLFSQIFLLSLVYIPRNYISVIFQKEIDVLSLMLYILENIECRCQREKYLKDLTQECFWLFLDQGSNQIRQKVSNRLVEKQWIKFFQKDSDIVHECYKILQIDP